MEAEENMIGFRMYDFGFRIYLNFGKPGNYT